MTYEFRLPDIGEGVAEGEVVQWFVREGETIKEDAPLVSILTDKANVEIPSPRAGVIARLHAQVGERVKVGGLLVTIEETGGPRAGAAAPPPSGGPGTAPAAPTVPAAATPAARGQGSEPPPAPPAGPILASPAVRRLASERGIDLAKVRGSGPGGRVLEADLSGAGTGGTAAEATRSPPTADATPTVGPVPPLSAADPGDTTRIPIRGIRRVIAEHMTEATHRAAHFTYVEEIDAGELVHVRDRMAKHIESTGTKLTYLPFIVKAVVAGLKAHPAMNATMDDARNEIVVHKRIHIGIATAGPEGLIVPVIHDADRKALRAISQEIQDLSERGRAGKLHRDELTGSTFTITSLGALGGILATPILNYPEVAILGVHKIRKVPTYLSDGSIGPGHVMNLSVSLDHRVLDGIVGAQFLATVKSYLEDMHQLFAELT